MSEQDLIEVYWLSAILMNMLFELNEQQSVTALSDTISRLASELQSMGINPEEYEVDVILSSVEYAEDDDNNPFTDFVNTLFEDGD